MSDAKELEEPHTNPLDEMLLKMNEEFPSEEEYYNTVVARIVAIQHQIQDIASIAAGKIKEKNNSLQNQWRLHGAFVRDYTFRRLPRNPETGEIKKRNYKAPNMAGGVFFRGRPERYKAYDPKSLLDRLKELSSPFVRCFEDQCVFQGTQEELKSIWKELEEKKISSIESGLEYSPGDLLATCQIGVTKPWTPSQALAVLGSAFKSEDTKENEE